MKKTIVVPLQLWISVSILSASSQLGQALGCCLGVSSHLESGAWLVLGGTEILISMIIINSEMSIPHSARRGAAQLCVRKGCDVGEVEWRNN